MTRETRIGLVVGLLFIIMFGFVLTEVANNNPSPPTSVVAVGTPTNAGPAGSSEYGFIPVVPTMDPDRHPAPAAGLPPTRPADDGTPPATPGSGGVVRVDMPRAEPIIGEDTRNISSGTGAPPPSGGGAVTGGSETKLIGELPPGVYGPGDAAGARLLGDGAHPGTRDGLGAAGGTAAAPARIYEVKQGDTLTRIARQIYGPACASKHTLILEANKDKLKSPTALKIGMKLVIPPLPAASPAHPTPTTEPGNPTPGTRTGHSHSPTDVVRVPDDAALPPSLIATDHVASPATGKTYVVKGGDTIQKLARTYRTSVDKILELNRGVKPNKLKIGQKLDIPE